VSLVLKYGECQFARDATLGCAAILFNQLTSAFDQRKNDAAHAVHDAGYPEPRPDYLLRDRSGVPRRAAGGMSSSPPGWIALKGLCRDDRRRLPPVQYCTPASGCRERKLCRSRAHTARPSRSARQAQVTVDVFGGENRTPEFLAKNPAGTVPALVLEDGTIVGETMAICQYLDEKFGPSDAVGKTPEDRILTRQWLGRIDEHCNGPLTLAFRNGPMLDFFTGRVPDEMMPDAAPGALKVGTEHGFAFCDKHLEGKKFFCGDRCTLADIRLFCNYKFFNKMAGAAGFTIDPKYKNLCAWLANCEATAGGKAAFPPAE